VKRKAFDKLYNNWGKTSEDLKVISEYFGYTFSIDSPFIEDEENFAYARDDYLSRFQTVKVAAYPELLWTD
jgi:hypothetical protein